MTLVISLPLAYSLIGISSILAVLIGMIAALISNNRIFYYIFKMFIFRNDIIFFKDYEFTFSGNNFYYVYKNTPKTENFIMYKISMYSNGRFIGNIHLLPASNYFNDAVNVFICDKLFKILEHKRKLKFDKHYTRNIKLKNFL